MRAFLFTLLLCASAAAQQQAPSLVKFLGFTAAQTAAIQQLNATYYQFVQTKQQRESVIYNEINAEYAKASPDPLSLGQRYIELDSINQEIATAQTTVQGKITALLTPAQISLLGQISTAIVQSSLIQDAGCAFLGKATSYQFGNAIGGAFLIGNLSTVPYPTAIAYNFYPGCGSAFPISIRTYLSLTDVEVSGILVLESANNAFNTQKQNRIADVQVEIRDETAKPAPDSLALGVRYTELIEISQEVKQADQQGRAAARALLTSSQQAQLQELLKAGDLPHLVS